MIVTIGNRSILALNEGEFTNELGLINDPVEISISGHGTTSIIALLNSQSSFLTYFRFQDEDHGFHSFDLKRDPNIEEEFTLKNGQVDIYPLHYLRSREEGIEALKFYFKTGQMTPDVDWIS